MDEDFLELFRVPPSPIIRAYIGVTGSMYRVFQTKARFRGCTSACRLTHPKATHLQLSGQTALYVSSHK